LLSLSLAFGLTSFALSFFVATGLDLYISLFIVEFFVLTLLHSPFKPRTQKIINLLSYGLFGVFVVIVALKVLEIVVGVGGFL
jgi:hypothetical protein